MPKTTTYLLATIGLCACLVLVYLLGMRSGLRQDGAYQILKDIKARFMTNQSGSHELQRFNEFDQLAWYQGKIEIPTPSKSKNRLVAFAFGQSNSANHGGEKFISQDPRILNFWDGKFYQASDPLLGASGTSGSVWTAVGHQLISYKLTDQFVIVSAGITRTSAQEWANGGRLHPMFLRRLQELKRLGLEVNHFYWHQGETDYGTPPEIYRSKLVQIIATTKRYFPNSKFFVAQASMCKTMPSSPDLLRVQSALALEPGVYPGPNTDTINRDDRFDDCHFSGRGLARAAKSWVDAIMSAERNEAHPR